MCMKEWFPFLSMSGLQPISLHLILPLPILFARYNVFVVLRHGDAYHFNNLWMDITTIPPGDTAQTVRANLKLGDNKKWLGNTIDDIVEHRVLINSNPLKFKAGNYKFILQQVMREDPLQSILNAGIRVEKVNRNDIIISFLFIQ